MFTIRTRYRGPTDTKGSRIIATDGESRIAVSYDCALEARENHRAAVDALMAKTGHDSWEFVTGNFPGDSYYHIVTKWHYRPREADGNPAQHGMPMHFMPRA